MSKTKEELEREYKDREEAKRDVKLWLSADWEIKEETPEYFLLEKNTATGWGHFWVFVLTVWFTFGLGNLAYWYFSKKKKKIVK